MFDRVEAQLVAEANARLEARNAAIEADFMERVSRTSRARRGRLWLMVHGDGMTYAEAARSEGVSPARIGDIVRRVEREIAAAADRWQRRRAPFGVWPNEPPTLPAQEKQAPAAPIDTRMDGPSPYVVKWWAT